MSLYDQFFSEINKDFMFNMANNVLSKDHNVFIKGNEEAYNIFLEDMDDIFKNHNFEDISDINKLLLDTTIKKHRLTGDNVGDDGTDTDNDGDYNYKITFKTYVFMFMCISCELSISTLFSQSRLPTKVSRLKT